ncbi:hypothetical protein [Roseimaritima multifibrata]|uniref:hypothetical protein n=1 Tax=Roseimaritima multifibrata TaxID=1930274 RepID=UPI001C54ECA4|nr:hypothetical protein [Roseimaritima multifibrata]
MSFLLWFVPSDSIGKKDGDRILAAIENFERRWSSLSATDAEERKGIVGEFQKLRQQFESNHGNMLASDVDSIRSRFGVTDCCGNSDHPLDELGELADEALGDVLVDPGCTY